MSKSDAQLQSDVMEELHWDPAVGRSEIAVVACDGVVTLAGQANSFAKKQAAVRAAERVKGVHAVADEVIVALPAASRRTDTDLAHYERAAAERAVRNLTGVRSWAERKDAERAAWSAPGVTDVDDELIVSA